MPEHFLADVFNAISLSGLYVMLALPVALVYGILELVNFAHGELIMVGAFTMLTAAGLGAPAWVPLMIIVAICFALLMERAAFRPVRGASADTLLVTSFAVSFLLQDIAQIVFGTRPSSVPTPTWTLESVRIGGIDVQWLNIATVIFAIIFLVGLTLFLHRTQFGIQMRACAEDFTMARLLGVRGNLIVVIAFAISGLLAATASFILVGQSGSALPTMGLDPVIIAFVATMVGGLGSLSGAAFGAVGLAVSTIMAETLLPLSLRPARDAVVYGVVLVLLLARPSGLVVRHVERV